VDNGGTLPSPYPRDSATVPNSDADETRRRETGEDERFEQWITQTG
jgi:hypothetical protein